MRALCVNCVCVSVCVWCVCPSRTENAQQKQRLMNDRGPIISFAGDSRAAATTTWLPTVVAASRPGWMARGSMLHERRRVRGDVWGEGQRPAELGWQVRVNREGMSWHMMMFSFPLIRQRPCMHPCLSTRPAPVIILNQFRSRLFQETLSILHTWDMYPSLHCT